jgi:hypothetical protein
LSLEAEAGYALALCGDTVVSDHYMFLFQVTDGP